ncbi:LacI family DNA-binding transcriptional regulator [Nocardia abscessus]|uniref:LacI family DNA-binding transcriptional regulator n=1 Tax=Nocardia abscessus TaxID=120957 RepID=UPI0024577CE2|nr:LacI family DNA-binding transcriptional regulator [Nocardia abscessus]
MQDVANRAGVSRATASLVVRGTGRVSQRTRDRVHQVMDELGYVYNRSAASLRAGRSNVIGVLVTTVTNPFFAEVIVGLEQRLARLGYVSLLANTLNDADRQARLVTFLQESNVAGVVMVPAFTTDPRTLHSLAAREIPLLFLTRTAGEEPDLYLRTDDVADGELAADHLFRHGCRTVAYLGGPTDSVARRDHLAGARAAAERHNISPERLIDITSPTTARGGLAAGRQLLAGESACDGIICHSDDIALGVYRALHDAGRAASIPVISFDDVGHAELMEPPLTTIRRQPLEFGRRAAQLLHDRLTGAITGPVTSVVPSELTIRRSCGCRPDSPRTD